MGIGLVILAIVSFFVNDYGQNNVQVSRWLYSFSFFFIGVSVIIESRGYRVMTKMFVAFTDTEFIIKTDYVKHRIEWSFVSRLAFSEKMLMLDFKHGGVHQVPIGHLSEECIASLKADFSEQAKIHDVECVVD